VAYRRHRRDVRIDLGVIEMGKTGRLTDYIEKPAFHYSVSMGIYVSEPAESHPTWPAVWFPELILCLLRQTTVQNHPFDRWLNRPA
jgi:hypothetical protein